MAGIDTFAVKRGTEMTTAQMEQMLQYRRLASQMRREIASLTEKYPDQWVAMSTGGELIIGVSMDEILAALDERGIRREDVVIEFLEANPVTMIV